MPIVEEYSGHPVYGSAVDILIGEVFHAALRHLIEQETGLAGLTISPMHTRYALHEGRPVGKASMDAIARSVAQERPNLAPHAAPDGTVTMEGVDDLGLEFFGHGGHRDGLLMDSHADIERARLAHGCPLGVCPASI
jgi:hypothetical protein